MPVIEHFLRRMRLQEFLDACIGQGRAQMAGSASLLTLVRNILVGREPIYGIQEWADQYEPRQLGLSAGEVDRLNDDRVGRALDSLFDAGYASLVLAVTRHVLKEFDLKLDQLHNDSTTLTFMGAYRGAFRGRTKRGKETLAIVFGKNKDHRPDLKQLLLVLTVSEDGGVPVHFTVLDGNTTDDQTHRQTWDFLFGLRGSPDFIYVADCKLASKDNMQYITARGGTFVTVLPRSRAEDDAFRARVDRGVLERIQWNEIHRKVEKIAGGGEKIVDIVSVEAKEVQTAEGYRLFWYLSTLKKSLDSEARAHGIQRALEAFAELRERLQSPKTRLRERDKVQQEIDKMLAAHEEARFVSFMIWQRLEEKFRQESPGRPGKNTRYVRQVRKRFELSYEIDEPAVKIAAAHDGIFPLITNHREFTAHQVYLTYKKQPIIEKRYAQLKSGLEVAPVWLKEVARIEALACVYYLAMLAQALIERELRQGMVREGLEFLLLYPEARKAKAPCTGRILALFDNIQKHVLTEPEGAGHTFRTRLSPAQKEVLRLLRIPPKLYEKS
jgi:transposase